MVPFGKGGVGSLTALGCRARVFYQERERLAQLLPALVTVVESRRFATDGRATQPCRERCSARAGEMLLGLREGGSRRGNLWRGRAGSCGAYYVVTF
jgi:hypothetical protein